MVDPSGTDNFSISAVIPTYNRVNLLRHALDSILSQSHQVNEIIVVDDGSTDNTVEKLSIDYNTVKFLEQNNLGVSSARNLGIAKAKSTWIAFLDSDDQWNPKKIEKQIQHLSENPELKACHTGEKWIRNGIPVQTASFLNKSTERLFERSLERCIICPSSVIISRSVFERIGVFDPDLPICEDYDFWLRLLLTYEIGLVDEPLVLKTGGHADQLSTSTWGLARFHLKSLEKILRTKNINPHRREQVLHTIAYKAELLTKGFIKHEKDIEAKKYRKKNLWALEQLSQLDSISAL